MTAHRHRLKAYTGQPVTIAQQRVIEDASELFSAPRFSVCESCNYVEIDSRPLNEFGGTDKMMRQHNLRLA